MYNQIFYTVDVFGHTGIVTDKPLIIKTIFKHSLFHDNLLKVVLAGLERFELPTAGFEDQNSSTELQADNVWHGC